jgi:nitrogen fixation protein NifU and related proteins
VSDGYSETVLDHYESPRNRGIPSDATAVVTRTNPVCGDRLVFSLSVDGNRVVAANFEVDGCVAATASASVATELVIGKELDEAQAVDREAIEDALDGLPPARSHGAVLAADALQAAVSAAAQLERAGPLT